MKILTKTKIVESFHFPLSEALSFSILLWSIWGLAETLYWQKIAPLFDPTAEKIASVVYVEGFLLYVVIATVSSLFAYSVIKLSLVALEHFEAYLFRGITLASILGLFFAIVLNYYLPDHLFGSSLPVVAQYGLAAVLVCLAAAATFLVFRWASSVEFRIRRSGTLMLTVFSISLVLSFIHFPIFSSGPNDNPFHFETKEITAARKLTAFYYLEAFVARKEKPEKEGRTTSR